jgi:hypothetical protein
VRECSRCRKLKSDDQFHRCARHERQYWCKQCRKTVDAEYHQRNKQKRLEQKRALHSRFKEWYLSLKAGKPCADCGGIFHPVAMQWDHLPGSDKVGDLGTLWRRHNKDLILAEIAKCELVCANCHAVRTLGRIGA